MIRRFLSRIVTPITSRLPGPVRRHPVWSTIIAVFTLLIALIVFAVTRPVQPEYVTAVAARGDLVQTVEAVGTVISERDLALQFATTGIVDNVLVKEGDVVKAGQLMASLRGGQLSASVAAASARVASARADLDQMLAGSRPEDIVIAEAEVANRKAQLDAAKATREKALKTVQTSNQKLAVLRAEVDTGLSGYVSTAGSTAERYIATARTSMGIVDDVFVDPDVQDVVLLHDPGSMSSLRVQQTSVESSLQLALATSRSATSFQEALSDLQSARSAISQSATFINSVYSFLANLPLTSNYTTSERETHKATIAAERTSVQTALSAVDAAIKELQDASAAYSTRIATEEAALVAAQSEADRVTTDIATYESTLKISEAQLALTRAGSRPEQVAVAQASLRAAQAELARAAAAYADTQLRAPIDGTVTKVNIKKGESIPVGAVITLLGTSPFRVEMFASEIDIPKVHLTQSGSIELDAFPGTDFDLRVGEVDPAATDVDGVTKYRVKLDFVYPHDNLKIGMTGDAEIVTGMREDVISVPLRSVLERDDGTEYVRIQLPDGSIEERTVVTGMEGSGGDIEVEGVEEGETVVVLVKE